MIRHIVTGPPLLQLYETNVSPKDINLAPVLEIIRVPVSDVQSIEAAERIWERLSRFLAEYTPGKNPLVTYGKSLNLEEGLFVGIVGWSSSEVSSSIRFSGLEFEIDLELARVVPRYSSKSLISESCNR